MGGRMRNLLFLLAVVALGCAEVVLGLAADECYVLESDVLEESGERSCARATDSAAQPHAPLRDPATVHTDDLKNLVSKGNENEPHLNPAVGVDGRGEKYASSKDPEYRRQLSVSLRTLLLLSLPMYQAAAR